jgi:hypothetical protein
VELYLHSPLHLHGVVSSRAQDISSWHSVLLCTGTNLPYMQYIKYINYVKVALLEALDQQIPL